MNANTSIILKLLLKDSNVCFHSDNVIFAEKLFIVHSVLRSIEKKYQNNTCQNLSNMVDLYQKCISDYLQGYYNIQWVDDKLTITP